VSLGSQHVDGGSAPVAEAVVSDLLALVRELHATPQRAVLAFAGAGAEALSLLHAVGGSSRTVLEAVDLYTDRSMREWIGSTPAQFTSQRTAKAMADAAWRRARRLTTGERIATTHPPAGADGEPRRVCVPVFGLACTATIATDRVKKGEHRVVVAVRDGFGTATYALTLAKGARERAGEERVVSQLVLRAAADACGVLRPTPLDMLAGEALEVDLAPVPLLAQFDAGARPYVVVREDGTLTSALPGAGAAVATAAEPAAADAAAADAAAADAAAADAAVAGTSAEAAAPGTPRGTPRAALRVALLSGAFNPVH